MVVTGLLAFIVERLVPSGGRNAGGPGLRIRYRSSRILGAGIAVVTTHAMLFARRAGFWGLWAGAWTWWALLAVVDLLAIARVQLHPGVFQWVSLRSAGLGATCNAAMVLETKRQRGADLPPGGVNSAAGDRGDSRVSRRPCCFTARSAFVRLLLHRGVVGLICTPSRHYAPTFVECRACEDWLFPGFRFLTTALALFAASRGAGLFREVAGARRILISCKTQTLETRNGSCSPLPAVCQKRSVSRPLSVQPSTAHFRGTLDLRSCRMRHILTWLLRLSRFWNHRKPTDGGTIDAIAIGARSVVRGHIFPARRGRRISADRRAATASGYSADIRDLFNGWVNLCLPGDADERRRNQFLSTPGKNRGGFGGGYELQPAA